MHLAVPSSVEMLVPLINLLSSLAKVVHCWLYIVMFSVSSIFDNSCSSQLSNKKIWKHFTFSRMNFHARSKNIKEKKKDCKASLAFFVLRRQEENENGLSSMVFSLLPSLQFVVCGMENLFESVP